MNMKKIMNWVLAATLVCGASVFTACTSDSSDNPSKEEAKKNRTEFIQHTRQNLKYMAENLNFNSWNAANTLNQNFNQYVLNNPGFQKSVLSAFMQKALLSIKPVEEGSELATMGYQMYGTVDFTDFNYRFTMNAEESGFDMEPADDFEVILNGWNPQTQQLESGLYKLTLKAGGSTSFKFVHALSQQPDVAIVFNMPSEFQFAMSDKLSGAWLNGFSGSFKNEVAVAAGHEYAQLARDTWGVSGSITSSFPSVEGLYEVADATTLNFSVLSDKVNNKGDVTMSWEQNGRKMIDLSLKETGDGTGGIYRLDLSQFTSASSIFEVVGALLTTRSLDECKITLLDDLTTTMSVSNIAQVIMLQQEMASLRRNYADQQTIDQYTQQLNKLVKAEITCKGVNQTLPMRLVTQKFGVDWWAMPAFNFSDENGYTPITELLDKESIEYGINILDHAVEPMQQSVIVVRQLLQYVQGLVSGFQQSEGVNL